MPGVKHVILLLLLVAPVTAGETIQLFDGHSLDGWVDKNGKPVAKGWRVEDGELVCPGHVGSIYTAEEYGDFELAFRWKIPPRGNSGVKYRVRFYEQGVYGHPGWLGCEYQMIDGVALKQTPQQSTGGIYGLYAPITPRKLNPPGEYNESRIIVRGDHSEHWLNGQKTVDADRGSSEWRERIGASKFGPVKDVFQSDRGRIELQDHGTRAVFASITLRPLDKGGAESN
ncbi:hypothetical protein Pla123a_05580 [Posidoniimonas polymericola]|uniref:3-keto-alpha-glucoside-1,2-lyase/3-keto-2-hydroxy-glucal hydratase domain-containing protein n=1 Tax=Posidoniimonas polymericola TaxID=2528002 RepID=A0A5C5ZFX1_9BACT|nr:DUF1080 domain-containing protein [Posidoniimonas polymericola]TWT85751.1 hypothetical protein Pla123a_05580 [Posidoniimonas polymericola]